jgi:hypothetical protein
MSSVNSTGRGPERGMTSLDSTSLHDKSGEVEIRFVLELCHMTPETLVKQGHLRGHAMPIVVAEVVDRRCVVAF